MSMTEDDHRRRPRRRGEALVAAIFEATIDELVEKGYPALTMESVAQRAGASKASLYRRWETRAELVMDAVYRMAPMPEQIPDAGELRADLSRCCDRQPQPSKAARGHSVAGFTADSLADNVRIDELRTKSQGRNRKLIAEVMRRAGTRGNFEETVLPIRLEVGAALIRNQSSSQRATG